MARFDHRPYTLPDGTGGWWPRHFMGSRRTLRAAGGRRFRIGYDITQARTDAELATVAAFRVVGLNGRYVFVVANASNEPLIGYSLDGDWPIDNPRGLAGYSAIDLEFQHRVPASSLQELGGEQQAMAMIGAVTRVEFPLFTQLTDWELEAGAQLRHVELHERYGGSRRGGIGPSAQTPNVFLSRTPGAVSSTATTTDGTVTSFTTPARANTATKPSMLVMGQSCTINPMVGPSACSGDRKALSNTPASSRSTIQTPSTGSTSTKAVPANFARWSCSDCIPSVPR